ncbi:MAG: DNA alkylation repair protein [Nitrososphaerales archaeon]|jgi:3-methyladenine DNA glycosylase AlkD
MEAREIIAELRSMGNPVAREEMSRFGIVTGRALGVSMPVLRNLAKNVGRNHLLAEELWKSGIHEARILAAMVDEPSAVTERQMENWVADFDSWDICDGCCGSLFDKTPFAYAKALEWSERGEEFVKRAGYVLMAELAVHDKWASDADFLGFFPAILKGSSDGRNFVKKAVNWALRQIGKRNRKLNREAVKLAGRIARLESSSARWVAADAKRELLSDQVRKRLGISQRASGSSS